MDRRNYNKKVDSMVLLKDLRTMQSRYLFLIKRIMENKNRQNLSHDEREAKAIERLMMEVSPKYNFQFEPVKFLPDFSLQQQRTAS